MVIVHQLVDTEDDYRFWVVQDYCGETTEITRAEDEWFFYPGGNILDKEDYMLWRRIGTSKNLPWEYLK